MMTVSTANYLLGLDKYIVEDEVLLDTKSLLISDTVRIRWKLMSKTDPDQEFLIDIKESNKKVLAVSLHHQDDISKGGLLRVDYYSRHRNPENVLSSVPPEFAKYAGQYLDGYAGHIHYVIEGYPPLAWAIPLEDDKFVIKDITNTGDISAVVNEFCGRVNLRTTLNIQTQLRIV